MAVDVVDAPAATDAAREDSAGGPPLVRLAPAQRWCGDYAIVAKRFAPGVVGAKSLNTHALRVRGRALGPKSRPGRDTCIRRFWRCSAAALSSWEHGFLLGFPRVKLQSLQLCATFCHMLPCAKRRSCSVHAALLSPVSVWTATPLAALPAHL